MKTLPLFPLRVVLYPGMRLHLHIFEARYRRMIKHCLERNNTFGVLLIRKGVEAYGPLPEVYQVGCTARIIHLQPQAHGRLNLGAVGIARIRVTALDRKSHDYLLGEIEPYPLAMDVSEGANRLQTELRVLGERYLGILRDYLPQAIKIDHLPEQEVPLVYAAAQLLQLPLEHKQKLLEMSSLESMLRSLVEIYRLEVVLAKMAGETQPEQVQGRFSVN